MKVLHVLGGLNRGGAETWLVQVLKHIDRSKYQFDFLVHGRDPGAYDDEVRAVGGRIIRCLSPSHPLQYAVNFRRALREFGPYDCVHSHMHFYTGYVLMLAAMMRVPMRIAHSHIDTRHIDGASSPLRRAYLCGMAALIRGFATARIAVSEHAAQSLFAASSGPDKGWSLFPLGIDFACFEQNVCSQTVRSELGIPLGAFVVGHVGRFVAQKNHRLLVDIATSVCKLEPRAVFLLAGDGPLRPEVEGLVRARGLEGRFMFAGVRGDVPGLMKGAMDCFLLPSRYEGLPLVLLEAQAAGLHCVVSDTVSSEGDMGDTMVTRVALEASPETWASQVLRTRGARAKPSATWIEKRSIETSVERLLQLYNPQKDTHAASAKNR